MRGTNLGLTPSALGNTCTGTGHAAVKVHAVNSNRRVVLDAQVNVLVDTKAKVAGLRKVALAQLVFLDLETTLDDLFGLGASDGDVDCDLFVTADSKGSDCVAGFAWWLLEMLSCRMKRGQRTVDWGLTAQLLEHLCGTGKSVTRLSDGNVED